MKSSAKMSVVALAAVFGAVALVAPWLSGRKQVPPVQQGQTAQALRPVKSYARVRGDGLPPRVPNSWFFVERAFPFGQIPREHWRAAQAQAAALRLAENPGAASWTQRGPTNVGGRITDIAVHPINDDIGLWTLDTPLATFDEEPDCYLGGI